jgi:uncharacterized membrane-anchored protein
VALPASATAESDDQDKEEAQRWMANFEASLEYQSGDIEIKEANAKLHLGTEYRYLNPEQTSRVLVEAWGNPPGVNTLGAIVPPEFSVFGPETWAVILSFDEDGYVSDDDASEIDYDELLVEMQAETAAASEERVAAGYSAIELVGWADPPYYDTVTHQLYWAKELVFNGSERHTLNYNIRALNRRGVLVMNAVSSTDQLWEVQSGMQGLLQLVEFDVGSRYVDFDPEVDTIAAYGIGALVAGKLAAKAGLLAKFAPLLLVFKKYAIVLLIAAAGILKKVFGGSKEDSDLTNSGAPPDSSGQA